jgi:small subunit ribosomal protein S20
VAEEGDKKKAKKELTLAQRRKLSPRKRERQTEKRNARNRARKVEVKEQTKAFIAAVEKKDTAVAEKAFKEVVSTLDRVKYKSTIHKNTAARRRSRMAKKLNALKAGAGKKA